MSGTPIFSTENIPDGDPFEGKIDEATDYYREMLYGEEYYYGPATDAVLHEAIRRSLAEDDAITLKKLSAQLGGPHPSEFETTAAEGLRNLIRERVREMEDREIENGESKS